MSKLFKTISKIGKDLTDSVENIKKNKPAVKTSTPQKQIIKKIAASVKNAVSGTAADLDASTVKRDTPQKQAIQRIASNVTNAVTSAAGKAKLREPKEPSRFVAVPINKQKTDEIIKRGIRQIPSAAIKGISAVSTAAEKYQERIDRYERRFKAAVTNAAQKHREREAAEKESVQTQRETATKEPAPTPGRYELPVDTTQGYKEYMPEPEAIPTPDYRAEQAIKREKENTGKRNKAIYEAKVKANDSDTHIAAAALAETAADADEQYEQIAAAAAGYPAADEVKGMSDTDKKNYSYMLGKYGRDAAKSYKSGLEENKAKSDKRARQKENRKHWFAKNLTTGVSAVNKGLFATLDWILPTEFLGKYDIVSKLNDKYSKDYTNYAKISNAANEGNPVTEFGGWIIQQAVMQIPNVMAAAATGGTSVAAGIGASAAGKLSGIATSMAKNPAFWTTFMTTAGNEYENAKEEGLSEGAASASALIGGIINSTVEIGGGIEKLPTELTTGGKQVVRNWARSMVEEGNEEVVQNIVTEGLNDIALRLEGKEGKELFSVMDDNSVVSLPRAVKEWTGGAAAGGILGGGRLIANGAANIMLPAKSDDAADVVNMGLALKEESSSAYDNAVRLAEKIKDGNKITIYDINRQRNMNLAAFRRLAAADDRYTVETSDAATNHETIDHDAFMSSGTTEQNRVLPEEANAPSASETMENTVNDMHTPEQASGGSGTRTKLSQTRTNTLNKPLFGDYAQEAMNESGDKAFEYTPQTTQEKLEIAKKNIEKNGFNAEYERMIANMENENATAEEISESILIADMLQDKMRESDTMMKEAVEKKDFASALDHLNTYQATKSKAQNILKAINRRGSNAGKSLESLRTVDHLQRSRSAVRHTLSDIENDIRNHFENRADGEKLTAEYDELKKSIAETEHKRIEFFIERSKRIIELNDKIANDEHSGAVSDTDIEERDTLLKEASLIFDPDYKFADDKTRERISEKYDLQKMIQKSSADLILMTEERNKLLSEIEVEEQITKVLDERINAEEQRIHKASKRLKALEHMIRHSGRKINRDFGDEKIRNLYQDLYGRLDALAEENGYKNKIKPSDLEEARYTYDYIDSLGEIEPLVNIIKYFSQLRHTASGEKIMKALSNEADKFISAKERTESHGTGVDSEKLKLEYYRSVAFAQFNAYLLELNGVNPGKKLRTWQTIAQLINPVTFMRNVAGNTEANVMYAANNIVERILDTAMSFQTGQRSAGNEFHYIKGLKRGISEAETSRVGIALGVQLPNAAEMGAKQTEYMNPYERAFTGAVTSKIERVLSYALSTPDSFFRGMSEGQIEESLKDIADKDRVRRKTAGNDTDLSNKSDKQSDEYKQFISDTVRLGALERTFNDDTGIGNALTAAYEYLNKYLGIHALGDRTSAGNEKNKPVAEFGAGDILLKYHKVPGNIIQRKLEFTPLGFIKAANVLRKIAADKKKTGKSITRAQQRMFIHAASKPITGSVMCTAGAILYALGFITFTGDDDNDFNKKKHNESKNLDKLQINWSAIERFLSGNGITGIQNGDILSGSEAIPIAGEQFSLGAAAWNVLKNGGKTTDVIDIFAKAGYEQATDMSMLWALRDMAKTYEETGSFTSAAAIALVGGAEGFVIPSAVRQASNLFDMTYRTPYKDATIPEQVKDDIIRKIPFISHESVPEQVDLYGETRTRDLGSTSLNLYNALLSPGGIKKYQTDEVKDELERLYKLDSEVLPDLAYENSTVYINGKPWDVEIHGKDYEKFSKMLGKQSKEAVENIINSENYSELTDGEKAEIISKAMYDTVKSVQRQWIYEKNSDRMVTTPEDERADAVKEGSRAASHKVKTNRILNRIAVNDTPIEDVLGVYAQYAVEQKDMTPNEIEYERSYHEDRLNRMERNDFSKPINGKWVNIKDWTPMQRNTAIQAEKRALSEIENGTYTAYVNFTGKWSDLSGARKKAVLQAIDKHIDDIPMPDEQFVPGKTKKSFDELMTEAERQDVKEKAEGFKEPNNIITKKEQKAASTGSYEKKSLNNKRYRNKSYSSKGFRGNSYKKKSYKKRSTRNHSTYTYSAPREQIYTSPRFNPNGARFEKQRRFTPRFN